MARPAPMPRYDPYAYLPPAFARAVARGALHIWCEFCLHARPRRGCGLALDAAAVWRLGECPGYREVEGHA